MEMISDGNKILEVKVIKIFDVNNYTHSELQLYIFCFINMRILIFIDFMKKYILKDKTMKESPLQKIYIYPIYPIDSKTYSNKGFVNINNGSMGGTHWTCFCIKDNKSFYFDSFGGQPDKSYSINYLNQ